MGDVKHYLRKMDFPDVVPEALSHVQKLWLPDCTSTQLSLMKELTEEFVFFEVDKWDIPRMQNLQPIKELQILERISWHFKDPENEQKLATFQFLFPFGSTILEKRLPILIKLVSLAIAIGNGNVLTYIGTWMQLCGCSSQNSIIIAKSVNQEYIKPNIPISSSMKNLPHISPLFCASLTTALANLFMTSSPPKYLVKIVLEWMNTVPLFCFEPLKLIIPGTFNFSGPQTPVPDLLHWTILSPIYEEKSLTGSLEDQNVENVFSLLHLSILESLSQAAEVCDLGRWEAVQADKITAIVETIKTISVSSEESLELALDRLAQCLQIGLSSNCIHRRGKMLGELFFSCCNLPYNPPLKIIMQKWCHELNTGRNALNLESNVMQLEHKFRN